MSEQKTYTVREAVENHCYNVLYRDSLGRLMPLLQFQTRIAADDMAHVLNLAHDDRLAEATV